jgi:hypothetical protein
MGLGAGGGGFRGYPELSTSSDRLLTSAERVQMYRPMIREGMSPIQEEEEKSPFQLVDQD